MYAANTGVELDVTSIYGAEDAVLEAARVFKVDIELAVLAFLGYINAGPNGRNVIIEDKSEAR